MLKILIDEVGWAVLDIPVPSSDGGAPAQGKLLRLVDEQSGIHFELPLFPHIAAKMGAALQGKSIVTAPAAMADVAKRGPTQ